VSQNRDTTTCWEIGASYAFPGPGNGKREHTATSGRQAAWSADSDIQANGHPVCRRCGTYISSGAPVYCNICMESVQLQTELKAGEARRRQTVSPGFKELFLAHWNLIVRRLAGKRIKGSG